MFELSYNGHVLTNVRVGRHGSITADFPPSLTLTPADMVNVSTVSSIDDGHNGKLTLRVGDLEVSLIYPLPPRAECHVCKTLHYEDNVRYCGSAECKDNPALAEHMYNYVCLSCKGLCLTSR